mmetsp:Transcript_6822/g.17149  ORF Transcript_6822/g.17149 Transcript_6822/m.17149 type:complete len:740 (-) Transcript_6822:98-2317(-)
MDPSEIVPLQSHEDDVLHSVLVHSNKATLHMGTLHPKGSLYKSSFNVHEVDDHNRAMWGRLRDLGVNVMELEEMLLHGCENDPKALKDLQDFAFSSLKYELDGDSTLLNDEESELLSDTYKRQTIESLTPQALLEIVLTRPIVNLFKSDVSSALATESVRYEPLTNLMFTRDSIVITRKGVILSNFTCWQRAPESKIIDFLCQKLGWKIFCTIESPGCLEGSDFFPAGPELCFLGLGVRTNYNAAKYMLEKDAFGTTRVAFVRDIFDRRGTYLEKVFNIIGYDTVLMNSEVMGSETARRRIVDEWCREPNGKYKMTRRNVEFSTYVSEQGFDIIPVPENPKFDVSHILNLGNGRLYCGNLELRKIIEANPLFKGTFLHCEDNDNPRGVENTIHGTVAAIRRVPIEDRPAVEMEEEIKYRPVLPKPFMLPNNGRSQTTNMVLMVAPTSFYQNLQAAQDNFFMASDVRWSKQRIQKEALLEYSLLHQQLSAAHVHTILFTHNPYHNTPDAVFPNNWFSTHPASEMGERTLVLYPMKVPNRRLERRPAILNEIEPLYTRLTSITDYELFNQYLEGTGSFVLDRVHLTAYMAISERSHVSVAKVWAKRFGYQLVAFHSYDENGKPIYHTNVMMAIGSRIAVVCVASIPKEEREHVVGRLSKTHKIVDISHKQVRHLCGNVIELRGGKAGDTSLLVMSSQAYNAFTHDQVRMMLENVDSIIHADISTIERIGGGGVRCAIAELF